MPALNKLASDLIGTVGMPLFDYEQLHGSVGYPIRDHAHPPNFLTMRGAQVFWQYVEASKVSSPEASNVASKIIHNIKQRLPKVAEEWTKSGQKLATPEQEELEKKGVLP